MPLPAFLTRRKETPMPETPTAPAPWPEGVIARYLTVCGATVDVTGRSGRCLGCGDSKVQSPEYYVREWAQAHAEKCRALPKPTA